MESVEWDDELEEFEELESAEAFLEYFGIAYDPAVVQVNRLHILQRFHDYLAGVEAWPAAGEERRSLYAGLLQSAYHDFVASNALTERVFRVLQVSQPQRVEIPITELTARGGDHATEL